ncbi:MAG: tyrosine-type recombinase/integrase [Candidatus Acidiferrales bacterium]
MSAERRFSATTVKKYHDNVLWFGRVIGDLVVAEIRLEHLISLKARMSARGARAARIAGIIFAMKSLLAYARDILGVSVLDLKSVKAPREARRDVVYLTEEELARFSAAINLESSWTGEPHVTGYCYRALVETLLASGMRISEALSLDRDSIDFETREAVIIGKGNRQRTVFFTPRALDWIHRYLKVRRDSGRSLFASSSGRKLTVGAVEFMFRRLSRAARMEKAVTPHMLRHTAATNLLHKGCPIGFIKEVLGHQRLETTCRFYLGILNKADTKRAFDSYMIYGDKQPEPRNTS